MIPTSHSILLFLTLASGVLAGGVDSTNWGIPNNLRLQGNTPSKSDCGGAGSFFTEYSGKALCCSDKTRQKPGQDTVCPMGWSQHKEAKICIPPQEISNGDCGEGFKWNSNSKKCAPIPASGKCDGGQWYHDRSSSCCDDEWEWNPPKGDCPPGVACPKDWFWHNKLKECKPRKKRSPIPDCKDWNDKNQCCGHGPKPSGAVPTPGGGNGGGHGGGGGGGHGGGGWGGGGHGGGGGGGYGGGGGGGHGGGGGGNGHGGGGGGGGYGGGGGGYGGGKGDHGGGKGDHGGGKGDKGDKGGHGGQGGHQGHHKRVESEDTSVKRDFLGRKQDLMSLPTFPQSDLDKLYCPKGLHACSVVTPNDDEWSYECIDLATELESCGGCASTGHGQDCTLIPDAISVGCEFGSCSVYSCRNGFQTNGTDCVPI